MLIALIVKRKAQSMKRWLLTLNILRHLKVN